MDLGTINISLSLNPTRNIRFFLLVLSAMLLSSCTSSYRGDGSNYGQVIGDFVKCLDPDQQSTPSCFCHELAISRYPDRILSCQDNYVHTQNTEHDHAEEEAIQDSLSYSYLLEQVEVVNYSVGSCPSSSVIDANSERRGEFCSQPDNWYSATCYCYEAVQVSRPERISFCASVASGDLTDDLCAYPQRTEEWLRALRNKTFGLELMLTEESENWKSNIVTYLNQELVIDDCDAVDSLLDLAFAIRGFEMFELAKILVDTNLYDDVVADHYVGAIWVSDTWRYIEIESQEIYPLEYIESVGVQSSDGRVVPANIVAYRRLNQSHWHQGKPPILNVDVND